MQEKREEIGEEQEERRQEETIPRRTAKAHGSNKVEAWRARGSLLPFTLPFLLPVPLPFSSPFSNPVSKLFPPQVLVPLSCALPPLPAAIPIYNG